MAGDALRERAGAEAPRRRARARLRSLLLAGVGLLYAASIPWYRSAGAPADTWLGLPDWVTVALLCYVAAAALNSAAWLLTDLDDAP